MTDLILAAVTGSPACSPILGFAALFASTFGAHACALHVAERHDSNAVGDLVFRERLGLRIVDGDPVREIVRAAHHPQVGLVVVGARDLPHSTVLGHVTREIAVRLRRPLLVVPVDATVPASLARLLIPLEGNEATTAPIRALLEHLPFGPNTELVVMHAFTQNHMPMFANHEPHETEAWMRAFRDRYVPAEWACDHIEMRCGRVEQVVPQVAVDVDATLTVVSWSRDFAPGHARLVNALLTEPRRPTLLVPSDYQDHETNFRRPTAAHPQATRQ